MRFNPWSPIVRVPAFIALFILGYWMSTYLPVLSGRSNLAVVRSVLAEVGQGDIEHVSNAQFAYALACSIVSSAFGLAIAMLIGNVIAIRVSLELSRNVLRTSTDARDFRRHFDVINQRLQQDFLIGHAWDELAKTFIRENVQSGDASKRMDVVKRTVRPQTFINAGVARDRLFGFKLMPTIPGYFVGLGLLLTFVGLVIALSKAASSVSGTPENMTQSLKELLDAATFKFSTSIAGLFSSLVLALVFRTFSILIEGGFERFCREVERRTQYLPAQEIMLQAFEAEKEQLYQLKQINDVQFFDRLGQTLAPALMSAVESAMAPLTTKLGATVDALESTSRSGMEGLSAQFLEGLRGSAGTEMREISVVLGQTKDALHSVQAHLSGSGEDFARRMTEATESFARLVNDSGERFNSANTSSREAMEGLLAALTASAETAKETMNREVAHAGSAASSALDNALGDVVSRVSEQMGGFQEAMLSFQQRMGLEAEAASAQSRAATEAAASAAGKAASEAAEAIRLGFSETVTQLRADIDALGMALRASERSFSEQNLATRSTVEQTKSVAGAFAQLATDVTTASRPLLQASDRIAGSTETMSVAIRTALEGLLQGQAATKLLAERLEENARQNETVWQNYERRFGNVDESLSKAVETLATKTVTQQENIASFVRQIDEGCAAAIDKLAGIVDGLHLNTTELNDTFTEFLGNMPRSRPRDFETAQ